jgi:acyl-CoA thioesterase
MARSGETLPGYSKNITQDTEYYGIMLEQINIFHMPPKQGVASDKTMTMEKAERIVDQMYSKDAFSQWLGIEVVAVAAGHCVLRMEVRETMLNGFGIAHGGISYSLADSALAFASNSQGRHALSIETSISHTAPLKAGDIITATATEEQCSRRIGLYRVEVRKADGQLAAIFKGTVYRKSQDWEV